MTFLAITTCNSVQWLQYGRAMAATFCRHWPTEVSLTVYAEGFRGEPNSRIRYVALDQAAPWLAPWKAERSAVQRGITPNGYRYRWDAVKFAHKIAALSAAVDSRCDVLIWLDADIVTHAPVTVDWLDNLFPAGSDLAWLDRNGSYPECGFLMFRLPEAATLINAIVAMYLTGAIFRLREWHDSYVIEQIVKSAVVQGEIKVTSLSGEGRGTRHPLVNSPLAACLDHLKGSRKLDGRSRSTDLLRPRSEPYWQ